MRGPLRTVLRPLVGAWALSLSRATEALPRPDGSGHVYADGPRSYRLLLLGSGSAASWGVLRHELGLAGSVARELAQRTDRGMEIFVTADGDMTLPRAIGMVEGLGLPRCPTTHGSS